MSNVIKIEDPRNLSIDQLRGIAVMAVVSIHTLQVANSSISPRVENPWLNFGQYGVELFFLISGWLMGKTYGDSKKFEVNVFARRRIARIFPLWFGFLLLGVITNYANIKL